MIQHKKAAVHTEGADITELIGLVRHNLRLLAELVQRYEVGRQVGAIDGPIVRKPQDVVEYLGPELADLDQEQLRAVLLDTKNRIIGTHLVYHGGLNSVVVRLADCFREGVRANAAAILLIHNHPSNDPSPSDEDIRVTHDAAQAGELLGIDLLDHVVVGGRDYVSLRERGFYRPGQQSSTRRRGKSTAAERASWEADSA